MNETLLSMRLSNKRWAFITKSIDFAVDLTVRSYSLYLYYGLLVRKCTLGDYGNISQPLKKFTFQSNCGQKIFWTIPRKDLPGHCRVSHCWVVLSGCRGSSNQVHTRERCNYRCHIPSIQAAAFQSQDETTSTSCLTPCITNPFVSISFNSAKSSFENFFWFS